MIRAIAMLTLYDMILTASTVNYVCRPYLPKESCEDSRFEFVTPVGKDIPSNEVPERIKGVSRCVVLSGEQLRFTDGHFSIVKLGSMPTPFDSMELPAAHTGVCKYD